MSNMRDFERVKKMKKVKKSFLYFCGRTLSLFSLFSLVYFFQVVAAPVQVATWNLEWFPSGVAYKKLPAEIEQPLIEATADVIRPFMPDIFITQEVRDAESCEKLIASLGIENLKLAVCSDFKDAKDEPLFQQCAIFTIHPVVETRSERWRTFGVVDPPRGFAYALLDVDGELTACFSVHLKSNYKRTALDHQLNLLKRELAAAQILRFIEEMPPRPDGRAVNRFIIAGDFNTNLDDAEYLSEGTLRNLLAAGFSHCFDNVPPASRVTLPGKDLYPDTTFDHILFKGFSKQTALRLGPSNTELSDHRLVSVTLE